MFMTYFSCFWPLFVLVLSIFTQHVVGLQVAATVVCGILSAWHLFTHLKEKNVRDGCFFCSLIALTAIAVANLNFFCDPISEMNTQQLVVLFLLGSMWVHAGKYLENEKDEVQ